MRYSCMHNYTFSSWVVNVDYFQLGTQVFKVGSRKRCLESWRSVNQWNHPIFYLRLHKMTIYFHMLCLIRSWWTRFLAMLMAAWLSQNIFIESSPRIFSSFKSLFNHIPSQIPWTITLNFAHALLRATTDCFSLRQVTRFPHI